MKRIFSTVLALFLAIGFLSNGASALFSDIGGNINHTAITWLEDQGVVKGYEGNVFKPKNEITRAEFLKILLETTGMNEPLPLHPGFPAYTFADVDEDQWYYEYIKYAKTRGIVQGYSDNTFRPNNPIVFSEAIKIISETMFDSEEVEDSCFESADEGNFKRSECNDPWYWKYAIFTWKLNIFPDYHKDINAAMRWNITRGDMAEMTYRASAVRDSKMNGEYLKYSSYLRPNTLESSDDLFSFADVSEGDTIVDFEVVDVYATDGETKNFMNTTVEFSGEFTIEGDYKIFDTQLVFEVPRRAVFPRAKNQYGQTYIYSELSDYFLDELQEMNENAVITFENLRVYTDKEGLVIYEADIVDAYED